MCLRTTYENNNGKLKIVIVSACARMCVGVCFVRMCVFGIISRNVKKLEKEEAVLRIETKRNEAR